MYVLSDWQYFGEETRFKSLNDIANFIGVSSWDVWWAFDHGEAIEGFTIDKEI